MKAFVSVLAAVALMACAQAVPVVGPIASCVTVVTTDALKGMTIAQILADAGPSCVADAEQVIGILLGSADPAVKASKAYGEARQARGLP